MGSSYACCWLPLLGVWRFFRSGAQPGETLRPALFENRGDVQSLRKAAGFLQQVQSAATCSRTQGTRPGHAVLTFGYETSYSGADDWPAGHYSHWYAFSVAFLSTSDILHYHYRDDPCTVHFQSTQRHPLSRHGFNPAQSCPPWTPESSGIDAAALQERRSSAIPQLQVSRMSSPVFKQG